MTPSTPARRALGAGPAQQPIRAREADLHGLPHIEMPDPANLRARGVLGPPPAPAPRVRRVLGAGSDGTLPEGPTGR
ncbi:hypothetical protein ACFU3J_16215 [Streptomyces sp. NPDC057411]|uniref:hypothetical protein n=1 Tax=unclassified Streptomyces TaxID=2593676 RepID=UPI003645F2E9